MSKQTIKPKLFVILGPTAIGKSTVAFNLAKKFDASIINADSLQVYKYFDIGTSKPSFADRKTVPHYLIDIIEPDQDFNAAIFKKMADSIILDLFKKNKKIILVGGTFLYVKILLKGIMDESELDPELRIKIENIKQNKGLSYLYRMLQKVDLESADKIKPNDYIRIQRALEVFFNTGLRMSHLQKKHAFKNNNYQICKIGLEMERKDLHKKINDRVDKMIDKGFIEEVIRLKKQGYDSNIKAMKSIGYKELNSFLNGNIEKDEAIDLIKQNTRRYAKRQMTWLRKEKDINWYKRGEDIGLIEDKFNNFFSS